MEPGVCTSGTVQCHCGHEHHICRGLAKKRGSCLCRQFLLFVCHSDVVLSEQMWRDVLSLRFNDINYSFCGYGSFLKTDSFEGYVYALVIRVNTLNARDQILDLIDRQRMTLKRDGFVDDIIVLFHYLKLCCVEQLFRMFDPWWEQKNDDASGICFGDLEAFVDIQMLYFEHLNLNLEEDENVLFICV